MSTLITRARVERARIDAAAAAEERARRDQEEDKRIADTREALAELFQIHPEMMTDVRGEWAGVEVEGLRFTGRYNGRASHVRLVAPCPDCGELYWSETITGLYSLADVVERLESGQRTNWGRPLWMAPDHECSARQAARRPTEPEPTAAESLEALIREIVREEVERRIPAEV